ncbi:MAG TPA: Na+/H+ antiporter subunit C [Thermoanaerobaculia bacterium]|nr:Na+/H+ antiporter subunit C [Thermoanaerobaculia bacterium]
MSALLPIVIGVLYAAGIYMMLRRSLVKLIIGLALLGHASNLLIFVAASGRGLVRGGPPIVAEGGTVSAVSIADPVPQALILTAIVIGFGVLAFALALFHRTYKAVGTDDLDAFTTTEES